MNREAGGWNVNAVRLLGLAALVAVSACAGPPAAAPDDAPHRYVVMLEGRNLLLDYHGQLVRFGFSTSRNVVASSPEEAERMALDSVRSDESLARTVKNPPGDPPRYTVTHQQEVGSFEGIPEEGLGYIFYRDRDTR
jgi:hypothetical protein